VSHQTSSDTVLVVYDSVCSFALSVLVTCPNHVSLLCRILSTTAELQCDINLIVDILYLLYLILSFLKFQVPSRRIPADKIKFLFRPNFIACQHAH